MVSQLGSEVENAVIGDVSNKKDESDPSSTMEDVVQLETPSSGDFSEQTQSDTRQESDSMILESNGDLIVGDRFWTIFCGEVERIFESARGPEPYSFEVHHDSNAGPDSGSQSHINYYNFLLRQADAVAKYDLIHPHPSQLLLLWQIYVDDIDPFIKILHIPSMTRLIRDLRGQYHSLKPATESLIMAISLAAISITSEEDISNNFHTSKQELLSRYRLLTEKTFEKSEILTSDTIESIQALAIYIYTLHLNDERKRVWALSGVLVKMALRLNLHKDIKSTTNLGTDPLENECRRRLWWQVCLTDSASNLGVPSASKFLISEDMFDTPIPSNVDDADIRNTSLDRLNTEPRRTDMTIFLVRCEVWRLSQRLQAIISSQKPLRGLAPEDAMQFFQNARSEIEENYLKHLRSDIKIESFANTTTQLFFSKVELRLLEANFLHDKNISSTINLEPQAQEKAFTLALSILNLSYSLQHEPEWNPWLWHIRDKAPPYHALSIVLNTICYRPWDSKFDDALSSSLKSTATIPKGSPQQTHFTNLLTIAQSRIESHDITRTAAAAEAPGLQSPILLDVLSTYDGVLPIQADNLNFITSGDIEKPMSALTNHGTWDDMINIFEPWDSWDMGGM
ncbi:hypothetical protein TWF718_008391 [Orbilia javanica]|uniref:Xylanolytic transcriptional activator regulatory domain-containing protein n=1 Tax=Orbilia javanica TaxID=47235 RepID=A0AAN8NU49_9PEZI